MKPCIIRERDVPVVLNGELSTYITVFTKGSYMSRHKSIMLIFLGIANSFKQFPPKVPIMPIIMLPQ